MILIVESYFDLAEFMVKLLREQRHQVWGAQNALQAGQIAKGYRISCLIVDCMTARNSNAIEEVKEYSPDVQVIITTGEMADLKLERELSKSAHVLQKPYSPCDLVEKLTFIKASENLNAA